MKTELGEKKGGIQQQDQMFDALALRCFHVFSGFFFY